LGYDTWHQERIRDFVIFNRLLDTIYLQEAKASSEVENIITTNDELYKSLVADKKTDNSATKEVLNYKEALWFWGTPG